MRRRRTLRSLCSRLQAKTEDGSTSDKERVRGTEETERLGISRRRSTLPESNWYTFRQARWRCLVGENEVRILSLLRALERRSKVSRGSGQTKFAVCHQERRRQRPKQPKAKEVYHGASYELDRHCELADVSIGPARRTMVRSRQWPSQKWKGHFGNKLMS